jgi:hypothetical protein
MRLVLGALLLVSLCACSRGGEASDETGTPTVADDSAAALQGRLFERDLVFVSGGRDSVMLVPWLITARALPGGVERKARGLLARAGTWESFFADEWQSAPTRHPWNIVPRGSMRLVIGPNDALEQVFYDEGTRHLGVRLEKPVAEWSAVRGETFRLLQGSLELSSSRVPGWILDLNRGQPVRDIPAGDWAFLVSGDSLQVLLHESELQPQGTAGSFRGWAVKNGSEQEWPEITVAWTQTRAFEKARRDVPVAWLATSKDGRMRTTLSARATQAEAGTGDAPQLPVDALFQVEGSVRIDSLTFRVQGLVRHTQP